MRNYRKEAFDHIELMNKKYNKEIEYSIKNSKIYDIDFMLSKHQPNKDIEFKLYNMSSTEGLLCTTKDDKVGLLNFASYRNPGGGFLHGAMTQEESLCHESTLYNVISTFNDYYNWNNRHTNKGLYLNRAIYSPNIKFDNGKTAAVITCAAPNWRNLYRNYRADERIKFINNKVLRLRINFILDIAEDNNLDTLILGAFGCGVFEQDPELVAKLFIDGCKQRNFKKIIFAIIDNGINYEAFEKILKED